jgi:hypothetical protein
MAPGEVAGGRVSSPWVGGELRSPVGAVSDGRSPRRNPTISRDGGGDHDLRLAAGDKTPIAATQAQLCLPGDGADLLGLLGIAGMEPATEPGRKAVGPSTLDQHPPGLVIAGLGAAAPATTTAIVALWTSKPTNVISCIRPVSSAEALRRPIRHNPRHGQTNAETRGHPATTGPSEGTPTRPPDSVGMTDECSAERAFCSVDDRHLRRVGTGKCASCAMAENGQAGLDAFRGDRDFHSPADASGKPPPSSQMGSKNHGLASCYLLGSS